MKMRCCYEQQHDKARFAQSGTVHVDLSENVLVDCWCGLLSVKQLNEGLVPSQWGF